MFTFILSLTVQAPAADAAPNETSGAVAFEPFSDQPLSFRMSGKAAPYVLDRDQHGANRRLVAVTPAGPLDASQFASLVGDQDRARRVERLTTTSWVLLGTQMTTLLLGSLLVSSSEPGELSTPGITLLGGSVGAGIGVVATQLKLGKLRRYTLEEASQKLASVDEASP